MSDRREMGSLRSHYLFPSYFFFQISRFFTNATYHVDWAVIKMIDDKLIRHVSV